MNPTLRFLLSPIFADALAPLHRDDLDKSGITEASRRAQGIRTVPPSDFERLVGVVPSAVTSMMLIPYLDPAGGWLDTFQVKVFPAVETRRRTLKYLQPAGSMPGLYYVRAVVKAVMDAAEPLYMVEGAKKAISAGQLGLPAVGFAGIEAWHVRGSRGLLSGFRAIPLRGRHVKVVPDGDVQTNPNVARGALRFAEALEACGARVAVVMLPVEVAA